MLKKNLSQHLHTKQIMLLKKANSKAHHKKARIDQYKKIIRKSGTDE